MMGPFLPEYVAGWYEEENPGVYRADVASKTGYSIAFCARQSNSTEGQGKGSALLKLFNNNS
jgi:hypothetical protein